MAAIRRENTKPEVVVRRVLWRLGARSACDPRRHGRRVIRGLARNNLQAVSAGTQAHAVVRVARTARRDAHHWLDASRELA